MPYYTYAIYSIKFRKIYIGYTHNLDERMTDHNFRSKKGYTVRYRPWNLIYSEEYQNKSGAMKREKELKSSQGRRFIWSQVNNFMDRS